MVYSPRIAHARPKLPPRLGIEIDLASVGRQAAHAAPQPVAAVGQIEGADVDLQSISHYLSYQYIPAPRSGLAGVQKLPPAHTLVIEDGRVSVERYWQLSYRQKTLVPESEALEALTDHLRRAVRRRLLSDVPLGAFLSGGIDSGLVVSFMAECLDTPVRTFSIGFHEVEYDELPAARLVAERYGTTHREFVVRPNAIDLLPQLVWHYGEPYADSSALPTYILAALTLSLIHI